MRWVPDKTGRFTQRPHYTPQELDTECDKIVSTFLRKKYGRAEYPITTDDLTILIEEKADLDSFADLSGEGIDVEGLTEFRPGKRPVVRIAASFSELNRENRLRTTLTHEYGHVHFHQFMFDSVTQSLSLFPAPSNPQVNRCNRHSIVNAPTTDWIEWQAGYACGALLMPVTVLDETARQHCHAAGVAYRDIGARSHEGIALIEAVANRFQTSKDAARVRLIKRGLVIDGPGLGTEELLA